MRALTLSDEPRKAAAKLLGRAHVPLVAASQPSDVVRGAPPVEAVVLGLDAPVERRVECCRELRQLGYQGPILALCEEARNGELLLEAGADEFLTSTCEPVEAAARLRACIRRVSSRSHLRWGPIDLDRVSRIVRVGRTSISLGPRECELLACLMENEGRVVSRVALRKRVWNHKEDRATNLVEVHMSRLRDKVEAHGLAIETVRRIGYRLR